MRIPFRHSLAVVVFRFAIEAPPQLLDDRSLRSVKFLTRGQKPFKLPCVAVNLIGELEENASLVFVQVGSLGHSVQAFPRQSNNLAVAIAFLTTFLTTFLPTLRAAMAIAEDLFQDLRLDIIDVIVMN